MSLFIAVRVACQCESVVRTGERRDCVGVNTFACCVKPNLCRARGGSGESSILPHNNNNKHHNKTKHNTFLVLFIEARLCVSSCSVHYKHGWCHECHNCMAGWVMLPHNTRWWRLQLNVPCASIRDGRLLRVTEFTLPRNVTVRAIHHV